VFNNIAAGLLGSLARPAGAADRTALPVAGDDAGTKAVVVAFLDAIGYDAVDAGTLAESWRQEKDTPVYGTPYAGGPAPADKIEAALAEATRP
jgi:8-hydroxy-5-deazaflavin:NADPH oxidoreductase